MFGTKLYRHIVGIPMGTNCAPLVANLFLFCYERDFMKNLSSDNQARGLQSHHNFKIDLNLRFSLKNDKSVLQSFS